MQNRHIGILCRVWPIILVKKLTKFMCLLIFRLLTNNIKWCTWYKHSAPGFKDIVLQSRYTLHFSLKCSLIWCVDIHDIKQYSLGQKDIAFTKSVCFILVKILKNSSLLIHFRQNSPRNDVGWYFRYRTSVFRL